VFLTTVNPLTSNDLQRRRAVSPLKTKIPSKIMIEKSTNTLITHSVCYLFLTEPTYFGIPLPSQGRVPNLDVRVVSSGVVRFMHHVTRYNNE
jgi:hypothetical protein